MPVFLSYSHSDEAVYSLLCAAIDGQRIPRWDFTTMHPGLPLAEQLRLGINECDACVFIATKHSLESRWCLAELGAYWGAGKTVMIFTVESEINEGDLPPQFQHNLWTKDANQLLEAIKAIVPHRESHYEPIPEITEEDRLINARSRVLEYMKWKRYKVIRFSAIRFNVDSGLSDQVLNELIDRYPDEFISTTYKGQMAIARL